MTRLEQTPVVVRFFARGSVEEVESMEFAANLPAAEELVRRRHPQAAFVRCCENEPDGGCVFVYPSPTDLQNDERDANRGAASAAAPGGYGRWVGLISSAQHEPACRQPSSHMP